MRYAIVAAGRCLNVVEADAPTAAALAAAAGGQAVQSDDAGPGDDYAAGQFTRASPPVHVPAAVSRYAFTEACEDVLAVQAATIDAAIAAMAAGRPKRRLLAWWTGAPMLARQGARMNDLQALMGWSNAQVRQVFIAAAAVGD